MIAFFGGGFDPVHYGHLHCADFAVKHLHLDKLYFLPYRKSRYKNTPYFSPKERLEMLSLATKDYPNFAVDSQEISQNSNSYTINSLKNISKHHPQQPIVLLMGTDSFTQLPSWKDYEQLSQYCHIAICSRPHYQLPSSHNFRITEQVSDLSATSCGLAYLLNQPMIGVSSGAIRAKIKHKQKLNNLLPNAVIQYLYPKFS